jgi:hypothetical protein
MQEVDDMADGSVTRRLLGLRLSAFPTGSIRIPNRKSGIRIPRKLWKINTIQISNRKYFALFDLRLRRFPRFLIYGSAIKSPCKALKT